MIPGVRFYKSSIAYPTSKFKMTFITPASGIDVWVQRIKGAGNVHISSLEVYSGGGKSTLARFLYRFLATGSGAPLSYAFNPPHNKNEHSIAMIPQKVDIVLHWKTKNLFPKNQKFLGAFFDEKEISQKVKKSYLSNFSGGQTARIFVSSALEKLFESNARLNYLILDEAFEGIDGKFANKILKQLRETWKTVCPKRHLFVLLITHLDPETVSENLDIRRIFLHPSDSKEVDKDGHGYTEIEIEVSDVR